MNFNNLISWVEFDNCNEREKDEKSRNDEEKISSISQQDEDFVTTLTEFVLSFITQIIIFFFFIMKKMLFKFNRGVGIGINFIFRIAYEATF